MALVRRSTLVEPIPIAGWSLAESTAERPDDLGAAEWSENPTATTVAAALRSHKRWDFDRPRPFDAETWWFRCNLPELRSGQGERNILRIGGLATLADVFLDGRHVLRSENMFHEHRIDLDEVLRGAGGSPPPGAGSPDRAHELAFRFAPVATALAARRPRPRWKTRLASHQQLRWIRTSLAGRMPGWSPPVPPVGPWRPVVLERWSRFVVKDADVRTRVEASRGVVAVKLRLGPIDGGGPIERAVLAVGEERATLRLSSDGADLVLEGELSIADPKLWWPHTHGAQDRYPARVLIESDEGEATIELGPVAFRTVRLDTSAQGFAIHVNDVPIFCRGACWTTLDIATLTSTPEEYARVLGSVRDAGMNMVRLTGTLFYEADAFYDVCDELGILVWQDFAFANMDYPIADEGFRASVTREASELLGRLQARPSLAILCGGSEIEQQAAMFGAARELWRGPLLDQVLPEASAALCPDVPYWPNSPSGGALPFHVDTGVAHYYGVGAYLRPFDDARRSRVRFASECLAFANVPEDDLFPLFLAEGEAPFVHAKWKQRTSKDHGSGWDFEDVRDHYVGRLFGVDPMRVRYEDMDRYLALSRVASGEVMARVFADFRRSGSTCMGGLVWFLQDLWPGAGWGVLDARGLPKSPYWFLKRALQPLSLSITDEGVNGLHLHVVNDRSEGVAGVLRFALYREGEVITAQGATDVVVPPRSAVALAGDGLLETFADTARAYHFGPPGHGLAIATLVDRDSGAPLAEAFYLLDFASPPPCAGLEASLVREEGGGLAALVRTKRFAHAVAIAVPGYVADDNYFDLAPGAARTIALRPIAGSPASKRTPSGTLSALNLRTPVGLALVEPATPPAARTP
jgi:beta-mannosidase